MKNILLLVIFIFTSIISQAQITITSADMPSSGDTVRRSITLNFAGIAPDSTGAGITWDYSMLVADSQTVDTFTSLISTGLYALNFIGASFAQKSNTAPLNLGVATVEYKYDFYGKNASSYTNWGIGADVSGLPLGMVNSPRDTLYRFPLNYLDTGNATATFSVNVPGLGYYGGERNRVDTVDGWGTLITPYGSFSVLRVKSTVNEIDTVFVTSLGFGLQLPLPERIEYKWLGAGEDIPLLTIGTTLGAVTDVTYKDSLRIILTGIQQPNMQAINLYPVPADESLFIKGLSGRGTIQVLDVTGRMVLSQDFETPVVKINTQSLVPGIYLARISVDGVSVTKKFSCR